MHHRFTLAVLSVLLLALACTASAMGTEAQNPITDQGSDFHYRSYITSITPRTPGLQLEVLEFADRLVLFNHTGKTITIFGYSGEPYARILASGTAEENTRSPATYLNRNFYGNVTVPAAANAGAEAKWKVVDRTGQFEWHDHRIHWMSPVTPPQVKDKNKRTKIFDWQVPIMVGTKKGTVAGQLFWVPERSKIPAGAIVAFVVIVLLGLALVFFVRRRRARSNPGKTEGSSREEVW